HEWAIPVWQRFDDEYGLASNEVRLGITRDRVRRCPGQRDVDVTIGLDLEWTDLAELVHRLRRYAECRYARHALLRTRIPERGHTSALPRLLEVDAVDWSFIDQLRACGIRELTP